MSADSTICVNVYLFASSPGLKVYGVLCLRVNILEEGQEHRFTQGFSTTKMMRMKDIKMRKRLKSSSKSWTRATETFLWQVFSLFVLSCNTGPHHTVTRQCLRHLGFVCVVGEWKNAEDSSHHSRQSNPSLISPLRS